MYSTLHLRLVTFGHRLQVILLMVFWGVKINKFDFYFCNFLFTGYIQEDYLRDLLTTMGDRFTEDEVDELFREAPIDSKSNFNYIEFTRILKHGAKDKDD